jgi:hypothetical protein
MFGKTSNLFASKAKLGTNMHIAILTIDVQMHHLKPKKEREKSEGRGRMSKETR